MPLINQYNCNKINFPTHKKYCKKFESNNETVALNKLYVPYSSEEITRAFISKHNSMHKK